MRLYCKKCKEPILADNINLHTILAKCHQCHEVFSFADDIGISKKLYEKDSFHPRAKIPKPKNIVIDKEGDDLLIYQKWFSFKYIPLAFFCIAWDSFLIFWYTTALLTKGPWIMFVFPIAHLAVGVGLTYITLAGFLNKTYIYIHESTMLIRHGPLPWPGNRELSTNELEQLFSQEEVNTGKNGSTYTYQLSAILKNNEKIKLLSNLESPETALFIEQEIESWLKIKDRPVPGEIART